MSQQHPAAGDAPEPTPSPATDDELAARITRALHARAAAQHPDVDGVAARLRAEAARRGPAPTAVTALRRGGKIAAAGVVTGALAFAGAGAAAAADPYSPVARVVEGAAQAVGVDWSFMPEGYTREQYEAFWATYDVEEMDALSDLWQTDAIETKARAGQMLLDGQVPPVDLARTPGAGAPALGPAPATPLPPEPADAFWDAGYTLDDAEALGALWGTDITETKARAADLLLAGEPLPVPPSQPQEPGPGSAPPVPRR